MSASGATTSADIGLGRLIIGSRLEGEVPKLLFWIADHGHPIGDPADADASSDDAADFVLNVHSIEGLNVLQRQISRIRRMLSRPEREYEWRVATVEPEGEQP